MDTLTHALSGALIARTTEPSGGSGVLPGRTRLAVGFWAAAFPDSDFVLRFVDPLTYLTTHRGVTHSVIMLPFWAVALALVFWLLYRRRHPWRAFVGVCALGIGVHIAGDVITSFGTMIFAPLSSWRAQIPAVFIIDPYFTFIIAVGLLGSFYWKHTRLPARVSAGVLVAYVAAQVAVNQRAEAIGAAYIDTQRLEPARAHALPQPLSPFNRLIVVEQPEVYHLGYVSLIRSETRALPAGAHWLRRVHAVYQPTDQLIWRRVPRYGGSAADAAIARSLWTSELFGRFRWFAMLPAVYRVDRTPRRACIWFNDLRFALPGRTMPFRYGACREHPEGPWKLYQLGENGAGEEVLHLIE